MPGITIISPSDSLETVKTLQAAINYSGPTYIRLTGKSNNPIVNKTDYNFEIGKSITIKEGKDISIFATGSMVYQAIKAAEILEQNKIFTVINMHTIKPLDKNIIKESLDSSLIVSIEEHNIIGGLGSAISEYLSTQIKKPKQVFIGIEDTYSSKGGEYEYLLQKHGLTGEAIANKIIKELDKN